MAYVPDPNLVDFHQRVARIEAAHARGFGFEAEGTIGRSHYIRPVRQRRGRGLGPVLFLLVFSVVLKGVLIWRIGPEVYDRRVARLEAGEASDRLGAAIMQADPVSHLVARVLAGLVPQG